jgi:release factor glutamine methyltransferase
VAEANAARHGVADRAQFLVSDWGVAVTGTFDLVVANPPYIPADDLAALAPEVRDWEPALALSPGPDGCSAYTRIAADLGRLLAPGGRAFLEIGAGQGAAVAAILTRAGFTNVRLHDDLDGRARVVAVDRR